MRRARPGGGNVSKLASLAILACLVATPAVADSDKDKHRRYDTRYTYGSIVSHCNHRANYMRLRGHDRREFVAWCADRGRNYVGRDWDRRDWDRIIFMRDRWRYYDRDDWRRRHDRDDWDDWDDRHFVRFLDEDPYWYYARYNHDWRYAALQDFIRWSIRD
jgi:hypothetical protein